MEHLLSAWNEIAEQLKKASHILLLSDYDGTLTPIVARPELAELPEYSRHLLQALANSNNITMGIISGRALADLKDRVGVEGLIYAGNHGLEIEGPDLRFTNPRAKEVKPLFCLMGKVLNKSLGTIKGVFVEDKGLTLSVHYRQVDEDKIEELKDTFERVVSGAQTLGKIKVTPGKKVYEVKPAVDWDKGKAVKLLMKRFGRGGRASGLMPIYIGDDFADEDGFKAIERYGSGFSVFVGDGSQPSNARYFLNSPDEVALFLSKLLEHRSGTV